jgi:predicted protein tyrosine phosphatase
MGYGSYSHDAHVALINARANVPKTEVFAQQTCHPLMNPKGLKVRESCDSEEHPNSVGIIFALDVTGSMGTIPELLAHKELPTFMKLLADCRIADPQVLFMAIGDATSDNAPLQIGQFETTAELMDHWLTRCFLEGNGGGQNHESYELAFYVAAAHTAMDCVTKRSKKGYLFLTGDEHPYPEVSKIQVDALVGRQLDEDIPIEEAISAAAESYHIFFLIPDLERRRNCEETWRKLLGDHVICLETPEDTCVVSASLVALTEGVVKDMDDLATVLAQSGISREQIGSTIRAVNGYMEQLKPGSTTHKFSPAKKTSWWKSIFG